MGFGLRDKSRYGIFKADSDEGEVKIDISIYGFGERIIVTQGDKTLDDMDTSDEEGECDETDDYIDVGSVRVKKPFLKCLKRYR